MTLRKFCRETELDPSNWSKIERGLADAPKSVEILSRIREVLDLPEEDFQTLKDLALIESIPKDLRPEEAVLEKLPLFFRTARGDKLTEEELKTLINTIQDS